MEIPAFKIASEVWKAEIVYTLVRLGVLDFLSSGPKTSLELVPLVGALGVSKLARLLRTSAAIGLLDVDADKKYSLNKNSECFADGPGTGKWTILHLLGRGAKQAWGELSAAIRDDIYPYEVANKISIFEHYKMDADEALNFNNGLSSVTQQLDILVPLVTKVVSFASAKTIVDIGGGLGALIAILLRSLPNAKGTSFDLPLVSEQGEKKLSTDYADLKGRLEFVAGDFFQSVPTGDIVTMKMIIHDWNDEKALIILKNVHSKLADNAKLVLLDQVIKETDVFGTLLDIHMMALTDAKERTEEEWRALLSAAGFGDLKFTHLAPSPLFAIEASKK